LAVDFALFLSPEGIALAHRQPAGHWAFIGETRIDVEDLDAALGTLKASASERVDGDLETILILPDDQILYTSFMAPTADLDLTRTRIEEGLDGLTPYPVSDLVYDFRAIEEDRVKVAVAAKETLDEARGFAESYGFKAAGFIATPPMERFPGLPEFAHDGASDLGLSPDGLEFGPDTWSDPASAAPSAEAYAPADAPTTVETPLATSVVDAAEIEAEDASTHVDDVAADLQDEAPTKAPDPAAPTDVKLDGETAAEADATPLDIQDMGLTAPIKPNADFDDPSAEATESKDKEQGAEPAASPSSEQLGDDLTETDALKETPPAPSAGPARARPKLKFTATETPKDPAPVIEPGPTTADKQDQAEPAASANAPIKDNDTTESTAKDEANTKPSADPSPDGPQEPMLAFSVRRGKDKKPSAGKTGSVVAQRKSRFGLNEKAPDASGRVLHPDAAVSSSERPVAKRIGEATPGSRPRLTDQLARVRDAAKAQPKVNTAQLSRVDEGRKRADLPQSESPKPAIGRVVRKSSEGKNPKPTPPRRTALDPVPSAPPSPGRAARVTGAVTAAASNIREMAGGLMPKRRERSSAPALAPQQDMLTSAQADASADSSLTSGLLARKPTSEDGPSLKTGLILTLILLVLLAAIAIWSVLFLPNSPMARLFGSQDVTTETGFDGPEAPAAVSAPPGIGRAELDDTPADDVPEAAAVQAEEPAPVEDLAALDLDVSAPVPDVSMAEPDAAVAPAAEDLPDIDAELVLEPLPPLPEDLLPSLEETQRIYAEDGIWPRTPDRPALSPLNSLDGLVSAGIDTDIAGLDAIALSPAATDPFETFRRIPSPPPFGSEFSVGDSGLVEPTPEGVLTPAGAFVRLGRPPVEAIPRPREVAPEATETPDQTIENTILGTFRPTPRPGDLEEVRQRQVLGGFTETELAERRPAARPTSAQEAAAQASLFQETAPDTEDLGGSELAIAASLVPDLRPSNIDAIVAAAVRAPAEPAAAVPAVAAAPQPSVPSSASVTRAATERNAIRLRDVNLIGVTGTASDRTALVRLPSGRFVRVGVGDRLDGGRVAAISENSLQYVRRGQNITLEIPG